MVKHPVLPDAPSRAKLSERQSAKYTEKYADYIDLGVIEWRKAYAEHEKMGKKAILFVMTDDTRNCDDVAVYLEGRYPDLKDAVLVIHTKNNGEISEAISGKAKEELEKLRQHANDIDDASSPYKAIVSVLMLKEGWDVKNVTTIVGLRPYSAKSNILPEQTLGRGLRKMYPGGMEGMGQCRRDGCVHGFLWSRSRLRAWNSNSQRWVKASSQRRRLSWRSTTTGRTSRRWTSRYQCSLRASTANTKNIADLDTSAMKHQPVPYRQFSEEEQREIVFKEITTGEVTHTTILDTAGVADYRSVIGYFAQTVMKELRLVSGYDVLFGKIKAFVQAGLFDQAVVLEHPNTLRNLSELAATKTLIESFIRAINELTVRDKGDAEIRDTIKLRQTRPFVAKDQAYLIPKKSVFNRVIGDSRLELQFASFLENCPDVVSYAKNYLAVHFKLDYVNADGNISNYYPDFLVKLADKRIVIVETKGREDLDTPLKIQRLKQWCEDINRAQSDVTYEFVFVDEESFSRYNPKSFSDLFANFRQYKEG